MLKVLNMNNPPVELADENLKTDRAMKEFNKSDLGIVEPFQGSDSNGCFIPALRTGLFTFNPYRGIK